MALPSGVTTATVTLGRAGDFTGDEGVVKVTVTPNFGGTAKRIIWESTGWSMEAWSRDVPLNQEGASTIEWELPHVDQEGWVDPAGNPITNWSYTVKVTSTSPQTTSRQKSSYTKVISPLEGQDNIDLDLIPEAAVAAPTLGEVPTVLSVVGETGAVSAESLSNALGNVAVDRVVTATVSGGTYAADLSVGDTFVLTLTGNASLVVTGLTAGRSFAVQVNQDPDGGNVLTLPAETVGVAELDTTGNTFETLVFRSNDGSTLIVHQAPNGPYPLPFTPFVLADQNTWYDADSIAGDAGDAVTTWEDVFGNYDATQATASMRPTLQVVNGVNVVRFDGINDRLVTGTFAGSYPQPHTVAFLAKVSAVATGLQVVINGLNEASTSSNVYVQNSTNGRNWAMNAATEFESAVVNDGEWATVIAVFNGGSSVIDVNGTSATGQAWTQSPTGWTIGAHANQSSGFLNGDIAEIITLGHAADADEIADLKAWLNAKKARLEA